MQMNKDHKINTQQIETQLGEVINTVSLLKETSCSSLYCVETERKYIWKTSKKQSIEKEFDNHRKIYECQLREKDKLNFRIPKTYFLSSDRKSYLMEYIEGGVNLLDVLLQNRVETADVFRRTGRCLRQYHNLATKYLTKDKENILTHNTIKQLLGKGAGCKIKSCLDGFGEDSYRIIFKDFTLSNVVLDKSDNIYFLDFQNIHYYAPLYYDLARFIDTTRVFALVRRPLFFLLNCRSVNLALESFLDGYDDTLDKTRLKRMQYLHRREHIQMKANKSKLDSTILKLIYTAI